MKDWSLSFDVTMVSKFRGNYIEILTNGVNRLKFNKTGNYYTWGHAKTYANNIIVGHLWINFQGEMNIINHRTNEICSLKYFPYSYFSKDPANKIQGVVKDTKNVVRYVLEGICTEKLECSKVLNPQKIGSFDDVKKLEKGSPILLWKRIAQP